MSHPLRSLAVLAFCGILLSGSRAIAQLNPGDIDPNAVKLDLPNDDLGKPFTEGMLILQRQQSQAVLDATGKIVVPFNKYKSFSPYKNGYARAWGGKPLLIDKFGKEINLPVAGVSGDVDGYGYIEVGIAIGESGHPVQIFQ